MTSLQWKLATAGITAMLLVTSAFAMASLSCGTEALSDVAVRALWLLAGSMILLFGYAISGANC